MKKIHDKLLVKKWYAKWHQVQHVNTIHYAVLAVATLLPSVIFFTSISEVIAANNEAKMVNANVSSVMKKNTTPQPLAVKGTRETDRIIVKFAKGFDKVSREGIIKKEKISNIGSIARANADVFKVDANDTAQEVIDRIGALGKDKVEFVEMDRLVPLTYTPNDPNLSNEWHLNTIGAQQAWDTATGTGIVIAVLDTGTDCTHLDLADNCLPGWNVASSTAGSVDINGHGTKTAGTAAAVGNNTLQVAGVAYGAKVLPIRITNDPTGWAYFSDIANGVTYAADHGAKIATASYQAYLSSAFTSAAQYMNSKGGLVVSSAGNDNTLTDAGNSPYVTVVSATDPSDIKASWSTFGNSVDLSAPGVGIYTTSRGGGVASVSGTSFSAPMTAAALAVVWAANPSLSNNQVQDILYSSSKDLGSSGWDNIYGWGRIDLLSAVARATSTIGTRSDITAPSVPANLVAAVVKATQVALSWSASSDIVGVLGYDIYRNGSKIGSSSGVTYSDSSVTSQTSYDYTVVAYDAAGNRSAASSPLTVVTPVAPLTVQPSSVSSKTKVSAVINWSTNKVSSGYVRFGTSSGALTTVVPSSVLSGTGHNAQLSGLSARTVYYYQVVASSTGEQALSPISSFRTLNK